MMMVAAAVGAEPDSEWRESVAQIGSLLAAGRADEAAALARQASLEHAGIPRFDYAGGTAHARAGQPGEAAIFFERVVLADPGSDRARLELARARFASGDYDSARRHFSLVLERAPPPEVAARIERFLAAIERRTLERRRRAEVWVGLDMGYDSNVQGGDDAFETADFRIDQQQDASGYSQLDAAWRHYRPVTARRAWEIEAGGGYRQNFSVDGLDLLMLRLAGGPSWRVAEQRYRLRAEIEEAQLDGDSFRRLLAVAPSIEWGEGGTRWQASGRIYAIDYPVVQGRELWGASAGGSLSRCIGQAGQVAFGGVRLMAERVRDSDFDFYSRDVLGLFSGLAWPLSPQATVSANAVVQHERYHEEAPLSALFSSLDDFNGGAERSSSLRLGLRYAHTVTQGLRVVADVTASRKFSNVTLQEYGRLESKLGVRYDW